MIPESFKQEVLNRVDIVDVIDPRVPLKKAGANFSACCPFHTEKTPSFTVSPTKQFYHCFGCGAHGNAISFLMEYGGLGYVDAVRELAESVGMKLPEFEPRGDRPPKPEGPDLTEIMATAQAFYKERLKTTPRAIEYLKGRGLTGRIAARFGIGYAPDDWQGLKGAFPADPGYDAKALVECGLVIVNDEGRRYDRFRDRIMFPILSQRGQVIGFGGRVIASGDGPKYMNSPETPLFEKGRELYGLPQARESIRADGRVFVVEGYMDVVALAQHGVENAVATLGTATTPTHVMKLLRQTNEIVFCFDGDAAGRKAAWHALEVSLGCVPDGKLVRFLFLPPEHDPDSFVRELGAEAFAKAASAAPPASRYLIDELVARNLTPVPSAEGRSKLVNDARPLITPMTAPVLQLQLLQELAGVAQLEVDQLARLYKIAGATNPAPEARSERGRPWTGGPGRSGAGGLGRSGSFDRGDRGMGGFREPRRERNERAALALAGRIEQHILQAVLAHPDLGGEVPIEFLDGSRPELEALAALLAFYEESVTGSSKPSSAAVVEHFRGSVHEAALTAAQAAILHVEPTPEEFRGGLVQMTYERLEKEANSLNLKAKQGEITAAERVRFGTLQTEMHRLRLQRGGSAPVV